MVLVLNYDLRMHCAKDVGDYQSTSAGAGIKFDVLAIRSSADSVEGNRTLNCSVDAFDCDPNDTSLII